MLDTASPLARAPVAEEATKAEERGRPAAAAAAAAKGPLAAVSLAVSARATAVSADAPQPVVIIDCRIPDPPTKWRLSSAAAGTVALRAWPSSAASSLEGAALGRALSQAGSRNSFVCQQLACMWSEQRAKVFGPKEEQEVFLATASAAGEEGGKKDDDDDDPTTTPTPTIAAAAIFYARPADASTPAHVYVELMVSSTPGRGIGALLLRFIEAFAFANAERLGGATQVRLLGVESAKAFYARCGYGDADSESSSSSLSKYRRKEMVKDLLLEQN